jgi:hypothetical protein
MEDTIKVNKKAIIELAKLNDEVRDRIESLILMADPEFVESYDKAKKEIEDGDLIDFDDL